jgi:hypothetical protein
VNPHRPRRSSAQLRESYDETLDALRRRFEQLEWAVDVQREVRNSSQRIYVELAVSDLRDAVMQQLDSTPA